MYKLYNSFECREVIKAAGGRWDADGKFWSLTAEQFATIPAESLASALVVAPPAALNLVEPLNGETFKIVSMPKVMTENGVGSAVCAVSDRGVLAAWLVTSVTTKRGTSSYYDRHRIAKGDCFEMDEIHTEQGITKRIARIISQQRPQIFSDVKWYDPTVRDLDDDYKAVRGYCADGCAWFANTDKKLIAKVKKAQATLEFKLLS